jgi:hypothetical protein
MGVPASVPLWIALALLMLTGIGEYLSLLAAIPRLRTFEHAHAERAT